MTKKNILFLAAALVILVFSQFGFADDLKGYMIPEFYVVGSHHTGEDGIEGQNGFWLRRIYLGYNTGLGEGWSARVRFEMNSPAFEEGVMTPYIKDAYVKKQLGGGAGILVGLIGAPSYSNIEKFWGYRFIEKTAPDFFKLATSRDIGIALEGKSKNGLVYTLMLGNYGSNKGEDNKGKGIYGRIGWEAKSMYLEANGHYAADNGTKYTYLTGFGGFKGRWGRLGAAYHYKSMAPEGTDSVNTGVISAFGAVNIGKKGEIFARYDHFTGLNFTDIGGYIPIPSARYESRFVIAGLNYKIHKMVQISPNIKYVFYDGDHAPDGDFYFNLTAKVSFKTKIGKK